MAARTRMTWAVRHNHIPGYGKGMTARARTEMRKFGDHVVKILRKEMRGPKSGRVYIINGRLHVASAPGQAPAVLSGATSRSLRVKTKGTGAEVEIQAGGAAIFLQEGTTNMAPRRFVREVMRDETPAFVRHAKAGVRYQEKAAA